VLQAVTQSVQPLAHFPLSISMPQRTLLLAPRLGAVSAVAACAISIRRTPGAIMTPARPAAATLRKPRRPDVDLGGWMEGDLVSCVMA